MVFKCRYNVPFALVFYGLKYTKIFVRNSLWIFYDTWHDCVNRILINIIMLIYRDNIIALQITASSGSTHLYESALSQMKYCTCLTDGHLISCLRSAITCYTPSFEKYTESHHCHYPHSNNIYLGIIYM